MTIETLIDKRALDWKPGQNGRPPNYGSVTYWLKRILAERDDKTGEYHAQTLARVIIDSAKDRSIPHLTMVVDRTDGAVANELNVRGVMVHVGDDYATQGIEATRRDIEIRQQRSLSVDATIKEIA